jgi:hypothetical protein
MLRRLAVLRAHVTAPALVFGALMERRVVSESARKPAEPLGLVAGAAYVPKLQALLQ